MPFLIVAKMKVRLHDENKIDKMYAPNTQKPAFLFKEDDYITCKTWSRSRDIFYLPHASARSATASVASPIYARESPAGRPPHMGRRYFRPCAPFAQVAMATPPASYRRRRPQRRYDGKSRRALLAATLMRAPSARRRRRACISMPRHGRFSALSKWCRSIARGRDIFALDFRASLFQAAISRAIFVLRRTHRAGGHARHINIIWVTPFRISISTARGSFGRY